jgi:hypothetical protein
MTDALYALLNNRDACSVTVYLSPKYRVTASYTRKPGNHHLGRTVAITYGKLNWAGRLFVAKYKRRNETLPVNEPQFKPWPKPRNRRK